MADKEFKPYVPEDSTLPEFTIQALVTGLDDDETTRLFFPPASSDIISDRFQIRFNDGIDNRTSNSNIVYADIEQPYILADKSVQTPGDPLGPGAVVTYTIVLTNVGEWAAYGTVNITDASGHYTFTGRPATTWWTSPTTATC